MIKLVLPPVEIPCLLWCTECKQNVTITIPTNKTFEIHDVNDFECSICHNFSLEDPLYDLSELEKNLFRFRAISNTLKMMTEVCFNTPKEWGPTIASKFGTLELANFIKYYSKMMGQISEEKKKDVLKTNEYLKEVFEYKNGIIRIRNNWIAHLRDDGSFIDEFIFRDELPDIPSHPEEFFVMFQGVILFEQKLSEIFIKEYEVLAKKFERLQSSPKIYNFHHAIIQQRINNKIELVNKKFK